MLRARLEVAWVSVWLALTMVCQAQTINLPSTPGTREVDINSTVTAGVYGMPGYTIIDDDYDSDPHSNTTGDILSSLAIASSTDGGSSNNYGESRSGGRIQTIGPVEYMYGVTKFDSVAYGSSPKVSILTTYGYQNVESLYTIATNLTYPSAGQTTHSATIHQKMEFTISYTWDDDHFTNISMTAVAETSGYDSELTCHCLVGDGTEWRITGTIQQATSADVSADPIEVDDIEEAPFYRMYQPTAPTHVGDSAYLRIYNSATSRLEAGYGSPANGYDDRAFINQASYSVEVP